MSELTPKQKRFKDEYVIDLNGKQAAIRAGYSPKTAEVQASRLLSLAKVQEAVAKALEKRERATIAKADEVLEMLTRSLRREEVEHVVIKTKTKKVRFDENGKRVTDEVEQGEIVEIPSKLSDALKAADLLGRYHALYVDRVNVEVEDLTALAEMLK